MIENLDAAIATTTVTAERMKVLYRPYILEQGQEMQSVTLVRDKTNKFCCWLVAVIDSMTAQSLQMIQSYSSLLDASSSSISMYSLIGILYNVVLSSLKLFHMTADTS